MIAIDTIKAQIKYLEELKASVEKQLEELKAVIPDPSNPPHDEKLEDPSHDEKPEDPSPIDPLYAVLKRAGVNKVLPDSTLKILQKLLQAPSTIHKLMGLTGYSRSSITKALKDLQAKGGIVLRVRQGNSDTWYINPAHLPGSAVPTGSPSFLDHPILVIGSAEHEDVVGDETTENTEYIEEKLRKLKPPKGAIQRTPIVDRTKEHHKVPPVDSHGKKRSNRQKVHYYAKWVLKLPRTALDILKWYLVDNACQPCTREILQKGSKQPTRKFNHALNLLSNVHRILVLAPDGRLGIPESLISSL